MALLRHDSISEISAESRVSASNSLSNFFHQPRSCKQRLRPTASPSCSALGSNHGDGFAPDTNFRPKQNLRGSAPAAVAIAPPLSFDEEEISPWRFEDDLRRLTALKEALSSAESLDEKLEVLDKHPRIRAIFCQIPKLGVSLNPVITLAMEKLDSYEIYLLKCLVAAGQEHVLQATPGWLNKVAEQQESNESISKHSKNAESGQNAESRQNYHWNNGYHSYHMLHGSSKELDRMLEGLLRTLNEMESFYNSIGGIIGYQTTALELIQRAECEKKSIKSRQIFTNSSSDVHKSSTYYVPSGPDLSKDTEYALQAAAWGIESLPEMGEIYPLGGAGDRLGLVDEVTGECLPVAMLPYCGRTLLEGLIRDLQAREFLHYKIYGKQEITPVAIMTSAAKRNNELVTRLCENQNWFGRGRSNFYLFEQPLIPAVASSDGNWLISEPLVPILKPGGHGVIWKLAYDKGVFNWFYKKGRKSAIVRQISNPIASTDVTLLALAGVGRKYKKKFGFASCERKVGAAEGVNVLVERCSKNGWEYSVSCIEYTEFSKLGIPDVPVSPGSMQAQYPANTNVLYVDLPSVEKIASTRSSDSLPGMILNLKKPIVYKDYLGVTHSKYAGRIECTMQNIADLMFNTCSSRLQSIHHDSLDTFLIYNQRRKVTSSAKKQRKSSDFNLHQTPDGSFYDITWNAHELLTSCRIKMPEMPSKECYIESGPPFIALIHPAIGPLWSIIRQKIQGGTISAGSELQLEIAEISWQDVQLDGSFLVLADNITGSLMDSEDGEKVLQYGERCGRCKLERVVVRNKGVNWSSEDNVYWKHKVQRLETLRVLLHGNAEFEARDVVLEGDHTFEVPDGHKMTVTQCNNGMHCLLEPLQADLPTWSWKYILEGGLVKLTLESAVEEN